MKLTNRQIITAGAIVALALVFAYRRKIAALIGNQAGAPLPRKTDPAGGVNAATAAAAAAESAGQVFNPNRPLSRGVKGPEVEFLQIGLNREGGYNLDIDGDFGPLTEAALFDARMIKAITYNDYITGIPIDPEINWTTPPFINL
jgi:hypothetical protein